MVAGKYNSNSFLMHLICNHNYFSLFITRNEESSVVYISGNFMEIEKDCFTSNLIARDKSMSHSIIKNISTLIQKQTTISFVSRKHQIVFNSVCNNDSYVSWCLQCPNWVFVDGCRNVINELNNMNHLKSDDMMYFKLQNNFISTLCNQFDTKNADEHTKTIENPFSAAVNSINANETTKNTIVNNSIIYLANNIASNIKCIWEFIKNLDKKTTHKTLSCGFIVDDWESPLENYISPQFNPGRMILVGDAARTSYKSVIGIGGGVCSIGCVDILANVYYHTFRELLLSLWFTSTPVNIHNENMLLSRFASEYNERSLKFSQKISDVIHSEMENYFYSVQPHVDKKIFMAILRMIKKFKPKEYKYAATLGNDII